MADKLNLPGNNDKGAQAPKAEARQADAKQETTRVRAVDGSTHDVPTDSNVVGGKTINPTEQRIVGESASLQKDVNLERADPNDGGLSQTLAEIHAADMGAGAGDRGGTLYSSHPISNFRIGRFVFEKTLLRLDADDAADFEALLEKLPPVERNRIRKIDEKAAEAIVKQRLEARATKDFDSSVGPDTLARLRDIGPTVGVGKLEAFGSKAHQDMNEPIGAADEVAAIQAAQAEAQGDDAKKTD